MELMAWLASAVLVNAGCMALIMKWQAYRIRGWKIYAGEALLVHARASLAGLAFVMLGVIGIALLPQVTSQLEVGLNLLAFFLAYYFWLGACFLQSRQGATRPRPRRCAAQRGRHHPRHLRLRHRAVCDLRWRGISGSPGRPPLLAAAGVDEAAPHGVARVFANLIYASSVYHVHPWKYTLSSSSHRVCSLPTRGRRRHLDHPDCKPCFPVY